MGRTCSTHARDENANIIFDGKPQEKRLLGRHKLRWEDNIKINLRGLGCEAVDWIQLPLWAQ
jgi:hypothetical protein